MPTLEETRRFWEQNPIADKSIRSRQTWYDYFREFDNKREDVQVEPYSFSNFIHGYEQSDGKKVLDYGCGNGYVLSQYAKNGAQVYGVDITTSALKLTKARFELMDLKGATVQNDGHKLPWLANFFDIACSMGVLHHIPDPVPVVQELHRVLKPGGKIIIMVYNRHSFRYHVVFRWLKYFGSPMHRGKSLQQIVNINDGVDNPLGVVYTQQEARQLLADFEQHRFFVNKLNVSELALFQWRLELVYSRLLPNRILSYLARRMGWNLYCFAYKPDS